jgi:3-hydroxybutyryl-CoA dehydrogenase
MSTIKTVGVAGSGTMGAGIAIVAARAGFRTIVYDVSQPMRSTARASRRRVSSPSRWSARSSLRRKVDTILGNLSSTTDIATWPNATS